MRNCDPGRHRALTIFHSPRDTNKECACCSIRMMKHEPLSVSSQLHWQVDISLPLSPSALCLMILRVLQGIDDGIWKTPQAPTAPGFFAGLGKGKLADNIPVILHICSKTNHNQAINPPHSIFFLFLYLSASQRCGEMNKNYVAP